PAWLVIHVHSFGGGRGSAARAVSKEASVAHLRRTARECRPRVPVSTHRPAPFASLRASIAIAVPLQYAREPHADGPVPGAVMHIRSRLLPRSPRTPASSITDWTARPILRRRWTASTGMSSGQRLDDDRLIHGPPGDVSGTTPLGRRGRRA